ncbi:MAG: hypothetical protein BWY67_01522 [Bacteroidetes bacterium ADurb.Bin397]|nr:MAG: hypothetical protein BWY67_01522 [Bacteroidetes bacterium ADurb.Bin397]
MKTALHGDNFNTTQFAKDQLTSVTFNGRNRKTGDIGIGKFMLDLDLFYQTTQTTAENNTNLRFKTGFV